MQCTRCGSLVADTVSVCPRCGTALGAAVDSYGATSFAPVVPAPAPTQQVAVKSSTESLGLASTMMAASSPVPPTMVSGGVASPPNGPHYVVTPAPVPAPQTPAYMATMPSSPPMAPPPSPSNPISPYAPPPQPLGYPPPYPMPMPMQPVAQGTPGLAVASLVCGLLGLVPFWIGFILCLLAITFGGIVLAQTRPGQQGRGLAITGLVFGLVCILPAACGL